MPRLFSGIGPLTRPFSKPCLDTAILRGWGHCPRSIGGVLSCNFTEKTSPTNIPCKTKKKNNIRQENLWNHMISYDYIILYDIIYVKLTVNAEMLQCLISSVNGMIHTFNCNKPTHELVCTKTHSYSMYFVLNCVLNGYQSNKKSINTTPTDWRKVSTVSRCMYQSQRQALQ